MFYVYVYLNMLKPGNYNYQGLSFDFEPFYVGKGRDNRYLYHINVVKFNYKHKSNIKFDIIRENLENDMIPIIVKIDNLSEIDSLTMENDYIKKIGRLNLLTGPLTNLNDGGHKPQDNYKHSNETKDKISKAVLNCVLIRYDVISPDGEIFENVKLNLFCEKNNLDYQKMRKSSNKGVINIGNRYLHKTKQDTLNCIGYEVINKKMVKDIKRTIKYRLLSPDGIEYIIYTDEDAIIKTTELNLDFRTLKRYRNSGKINLRGISKCKKIQSLNCQGWEFIDPIREIIKVESIRKLFWKITSPNGEVFFPKSLIDFCNENNLSLRTFRTFKNRGIIRMLIRKNYSDEIINSFGWMCETL